MSAALAVRSELAQTDGGLEARIVNAYKYAASVVSRVVSDGYLGMVKTIPQLYRFLYDRAEQAAEVGLLRTWIHQFSASNMRPLIENFRPDAVVCTHAFPCAVMAEYKKLFADAPPVLGIVTDFAVHAFWAHRNIEAYAVGAAELRPMLGARGIATDRVHVTGIPVHRGFGTPPADRDDLRRRLHLPLDRHVVALMGGGLGIGPLEQMMHAIDELDMSACAVAIVGRSASLERRVLEYAQRVHYPVRVLRFVENVYDFMHASDLLITKPGGLTAAEALAAELPLVFYKPLPGQEERNSRYLVAHRVARRAKTVDELRRTVQSLLASPAKREGMRAAMHPLRKPHAAAAAAELVHSLASSRKKKAIA